MKLSNHFRLEEFLVSEAAARHDIDMSPTQEVLDNLSLLVTLYLHPIRRAADSPVIITSGYRPPELNHLIGGSETSAHRFGRAADFHIIGQTPFETVELILELDLAFDQVIHEFGQWVHLGIAELPRRQVLTAKREDGRTIYVPGLEAV